MKYFIVNGKLIKASSPSSALGKYARVHIDKMRIGFDRGISIDRISEERYLYFKDGMTDTQREKMEEYDDEKE